MKNLSFLHRIHFMVHQNHNSDKIDEVLHRPVQFVKSRYGRHSVSEMLHELQCGMATSFSRETGDSTNSFLEDYSYFGRSALRRGPY